MEIQLGGIPRVPIGDFEVDAPGRFTVFAHDFDPAKVEAGQVERDQLLLELEIGNL